ncbi:hypothetical protein RHECNPAF_14110022 [Rhizobium etli CNPAF512]|nr:hypothetical protein RHECNPAF_14110022 [Rhizobium etli CNPAF512]
MRQIQAGRLRRYCADVNAGERRAACGKCRQVSGDPREYMIVVRGQRSSVAS